MILDIQPAGHRRCTHRSQTLFPFASTPFFFIMYGDVNARIWQIPGLGKFPTWTAAPGSLASLRLRRCGSRDPMNGMLHEFSMYKAVSFPMGQPASTSLSVPIVASMPIFLRRFSQ
jgi:hypothetical protein